MKTFLFFGEFQVLWTMNLPPTSGPRANSGVSRLAMMQVRNDIVLYFQFSYSDMPHSTPVLYLEEMEK